MRAYLLLFLLLCSLSSYGQKEGNVWYTGHMRPDLTNHTSFLDFNQNPLLISYFPNAPLLMDAREATTSVCDQDGNLLFFSNGINIYDRNRNVLPGWVPPNGFYAGSSHMAQGNLLLPINDSIYYAFVIIVDTPSYTRGSYYSTINRNLNQGLGQVIATHQFVEDSLTEAMSAVRHADGESWWILWHETETNVYLKMLIHPSGTITMSRQAVGAEVKKVNGGPLSMIKFSEQGERFAIMEGEGRVGVYDFDRCSGEITVRDSIIKTVVPNQVFGGMTFSPSGKYLYTNDVEPADSSVLYQYCLDSSNLLSSEILIHKFDNTGSTIKKMFFSSKLAPDDKIYLTHDWFLDSLGPLDSLSIIEYPDSHGLACGFNLVGLPMTGSAPSFVPPNIPNYRLGPLMPQVAEAGPDRTTCPGVAVQLGTADTTGNMTFEWVPATGLDDPFAPQPMASPGGSTTYYLMVTDTTLPGGCNTTEDTVRVTVVDTSVPPNISLPPDTILCRGNQIPLSVQQDQNWFYAWSTGESTPEISLTPDQTQLVSVHVWDTLAGGYYACRSDMDSMLISVEYPLQHTTPTGGTLCQSETLTIGVAPIQGLTYNWSPSEGLSTTNTSFTNVQSSTPRIYNLTITDPTMQTECRSVSFDVEVEGFPNTPLIYPNPTNGLLNIEVGGQQATIRIYNPLGQSLGTWEVTGSAELNCSSWGSGLYFLQWDLECGSGVSRLLVDAP